MLGRLLAPVLRSGLMRMWRLSAWPPPRSLTIWTSAPRRDCGENKWQHSRDLLPALHARLLAQLRACPTSADAAFLAGDGGTDAGLMGRLPEALRRGSAAWLRQHGGDGHAALANLAFTLRAFRECYLRPAEAPDAPPALRSAAAPHQTLAAAAPSLAATDWARLRRCTGAERAALAQNAGDGQGQRCMQWPTGRPSVSCESSPDRARARSLRY